MTKKLARIAIFMVRPSCRMEPRLLIFRLSALAVVRTENTSANLSKVKPHSSLYGGPPHMKPSPVDRSSRWFWRLERTIWISSDCSEMMKCRNFCNTGKMVVSRREKEVETWQLNWECHISIHGPHETWSLWGIRFLSSKLFAIRRDESHSVLYCNFACVKIARLKYKKVTSRALTAQAWTMDLDSLTLPPADGKKARYLKKFNSIRVSPFP